MGVRIRLTEEKRKLWMATKSEAADVRNPEEDRVPAITLTTRQPYSSLGTSMQLVGVTLVHFCPVDFYAADRCLDNFCPG